jgi:hypothetical protein
MKKHIVVAAGLAVLSTGAFATKARMTALNQDASFGSFYMDDERNAFRSAGAFSGNYVYLEHGTSADAAGGVAGSAEGGFFREGGSLSYGLYLNSDTYNNLTESATPVESGRADFFVSGNSGMKWGARVGYTSLVREANNIDVSAFDFSVNADLGGANVWFTMVPGVETLTGVETEADMRLGATYGMGDHTLFAEYDSEGGDKDDDAQTTLVVGAARTHSTDSGMWFYDISYNMVTAVGYQDGTDRTSLPVTFGFETKATSWLTWRASIKQSLMGALDANGSETLARTTNLGVGASLTWGSLRIDGTVNSLAGANLGTNDFMSNVSAVYNF